MQIDAAIGGSLSDLLGPIADADQLAAEIAEPLSTSAPIAYDLAQQMCVAGDSATDCRAYHGIWQYLRLTDVIRSVRTDGPLFVAAAARQARAGRLRRVLICGTADYSMLAHLGHASRQAGMATQFDVLDRCETTLRLNAWYGEQRGLAVRTLAADALAYDPDQRYDLVCAHSFLNWMDYEARPALMKRWHEWLQKDGEVCFSNRVDRAVGVSVARDHAQRLAAMTEAFFRQCTELKIELPADRSAFTEMIRKYGERSRHRRRDMTMETLSRWLSAAGLKLELSVPAANIVANAKDRSSAPVSTEGRPRMWFLARRT